jgi:hypothetical protein
VWYFELSTYFVRRIMVGIPSTCSDRYSSTPPRNLPMMHEPARPPSPDTVPGACPHAHAGCLTAQLPALTRSPPCSLASRVVTPFVLGIVSVHIVYVIFSYGNINLVFFLFIDFSFIVFAIYFGHLGDEHNLQTWVWQTHTAPPSAHAWGCWQRRSSGNRGGSSLLTVPSLRACRAPGAHRVV